MARMRVGLGLVLLLAAWPSAQEPSFEVASVKVTDRSGGGWDIPPASGQVRFDSVDLQSILMIAFDVPSPLATLRIVWPAATAALKYRPGFEIEAKGDPRNDTRAMLRTLLRERFGLRYHREVRQMPVYALTVKQPGTLGPWLKPTPHNCREYIAGGGRRGAQDSPRDGDVEICWSARPPRERFSQRIRMRAGTMQDLIESELIIATGGERPVIDATGLTGNYVWELAHAREPAAIFPALEDQLGLKLEKRIGPWEVIVIDHIQMPTPN